MVNTRNILTKEVAEQKLQRLALEIAENLSDDEVMRNSPLLNVLNEEIMSVTAPRLFFFNRKRSIVCSPEQIIPL